ncbi:glycoside hydrolase family 66 protein [Asaia bogorensis]|uniref:glycoside hydrolase family 66 protein n=1 Tax=Asaia bogorensis TaxID=91915 RepID=UPI000EFCBE30|nr:glycoside hydrolase family 66 protein [Asaia bogorensis]
MKRLVTLLVPMIGLSPSYASSLSGPIISHVLDDKAFYTPGSIAEIRVALNNKGRARFEGRLKLAVCSRGTSVSTQYSDTSLEAGASRTIVFRQNVPTLNAQAYQLVIVALSKANYAVPVRCNGSGTENGSQIDTATGALNIAANAWEDPIEAFVDAPTLASSAVTAQQVADNLAQYHVSLIQGYDLLWRHDQPMPITSRWKNLAGVTVDRQAIAAYHNAFTRYGIKFLAYSLWNGAWSDYRTVNHNISLSMGLFSAPCRAATGTCTLTNQGSTNIGAGWTGWGWQSDGLYLMNPADHRWLRWLTEQLRLSVTRLGFDGVHLDTLGDDGRKYYDSQGDILPNLGEYIVPFTNSMQSTLKACTDINQVSGWNLRDEAAHGVSCNLYVEPHPEFDNYPNFWSLDHMISQKAAWTRRPLITAYYPQQVASGVLPPSREEDHGRLEVCDPTLRGSAACHASNPGIKLLLGQVGVSGASQLMLGDYDHLTPGPFFPRKSLSIDGDLQQYLADYANWFVGLRDLLRAHTVSKNQKITIIDTYGSNIGSKSGIAGKVYYQAWLRSGVAGGISLTNLVGLANNRIDDPDGRHEPVPQKNFVVRASIFGDKAPGNAWFAAPDIAHGLPQKLTYSLGPKKSLNSLTAREVTINIPYLKTAAIVWIEQGNLSTINDWAVDGSDFIIGGTPTWSPNGVDASTSETTITCCNRAIYWDSIDFGLSGLKSLAAITTSQTGGKVEFRTDAQTGPILASISIPKGESAPTMHSVTIAKSPTGIHRVWLVFSGGNVSLHGWRP